MADFKRALQDGLTARSSGQQAIVEIRRTIEDMCRQVEAAVDGKLVLKFEPNGDWAEPQWSVHPRTFEYGSKALPEPLRVYLRAELAMVLEGEKFPRRMMLLEIIIQPRGYPVQLYFANSEQICKDQQSLETALESFLQNYATATKLRELMEQIPANT